MSRNGKEKILPAGNGIIRPKVSPLRSKDQTALTALTPPNGLSVVLALGVTQSKYQLVPQRESIKEYVTIPVQVPPVVKARGLHV